MKAREVGRIVYRNLTRASSRVRIETARDTGLPSVKPVFLLSPYRSGTTLLRYILDSHSNLAAPPETDFLHLLRPLVEDDGARSGLNSMGFDRAHVMRRIEIFASYFYDNYAGSLGKSRWVDKSPAYVPYAEFIREVFPSASIVVLHRHPLDQIESFTKGGTIAHPALADYLSEDVDPRIAAATYWVERTRELMRVASWPNSIVLTYERLCAEPEAEVRRLLTFIDEPWEPGVLNFNAGTHDVGKESVRIRGTSTFDAHSETYHGWPSAIIAQCWEVVGEVAQSLGYELRIGDDRGASARE